MKIGYSWSFKFLQGWRCKSRLQDWRQDAAK
jgi:hypothetical protein